MALVLDGSNDTITGLQINSANIVNGSIVNDDINASAAIASSKIAGGLGKILQVVQTTKTDTASTTSNTYGDISGMSLSITPASSSNKVFIETRFKAASTDVMYLVLTIGDGTPVIQATGSGYTDMPSISLYSGGNSSGERWYDGAMDTVCKLHEPNTTNAVTYKLRWRVNSGTGYFNRNMDMGNQYNVAVASTITAFEVAA